MSPVRVLLADDHSLVRAGLRKLLESIADFQVVGEAGDGLTLMESMPSRARRWAISG